MIGLFKDIDLDKEQCEKLSLYLKQYDLLVEFTIIQDKYVGKLVLARMITIKRTVLTAERLEKEVRDALLEISLKAQRILAEISKPEKPV